MEQTKCGRVNCGQAATKFCIICRTMLCRSHRIDDVQGSREFGGPEHLHVDALEYNMNPEQYQEYYCPIHHQEVITGRCINCGLLSCKVCPPEICLKGSGRHHDYDAISDYGRRYKGEISELEKQLQKKNATFQLKLKEACRKLDKTETDLQQIMDRVDEAVNNQITALKDYGQIFKEEICNKKNELTAQICKQIEILQQKEMESRNLLARVHTCQADVSCIKLVKTYSTIKTEIGALLQDTVPLSQTPVYELFLTGRSCTCSDFCLGFVILNIYCISYSMHFFKSGAERSLPFQLELRQTSPKVEAECEEILCPKQKETEIKLLITQRAQWQMYDTVSYRPTGVHEMSAGSTVIAGNWCYTDQMQRGKITTRKHHESPVVQLVPFEDEMLLLTGSWGKRTCLYTVRGRDSGLIYYMFSDSPLLFKFLYSYKLIAVTSTRQLLVLHWESQTLCIVTLVAGGKTEQSLSDAGIEGAYGIMASSVGGVIVSSAIPILNSRHRGHRLLHYDHQTQRVLWESEMLADSWLRVAQYHESIYVLQDKRPTHVWRLSLSDGRLVQMILCSGLPECVWDISMRGDTFLVAGGNEGITYFQINDVMY